MGYWKNGCYFTGSRILAKKDELTDKELSSMLKRNLEKAYRQIETERKNEKQLELDDYENTI